MTKVGTFQGTNVSLRILYGNLKKVLMAEDFGITKDETTENTYHLRAIKQGVTRIVLGGTRDVSLVIAGESDAFSVTFSVGAWGRNLAIPGAVGYVVAGPAVGTVAAAGSYVVAKKFEEDFWKKITAEIDKLGTKT